MLKTIDSANLSAITTFHLPASADRCMSFENADDLREYFRLYPSEPFLVISGGSNLLFTTGHFSGTILLAASRRYAIRPTAEAGRQYKESDACAVPLEAILTADAGCVLDDMCLATCKEGFWGLENLSGIPGCIGGAAVQNVGAYGTEFKDVALSVRCFDTTTLTEVTFSREECDYGYRDSQFKHTEPAGRYIVLQCELGLWKRPMPRLSYAALRSRFGNAAPEQLTPEMLRQEVLRLRDTKLPDPAKTGSAGSFFKNPVVSAEFHRNLCLRLNIDVPGHVTPTGEVKLSAAWLIDHSGCKPLAVGGASLWPSQPLVIVNTSGTATGADVVALEKLIEARVYDTFGVSLTPEVVHI